MRSDIIVVSVPGAPRGAGRQRYRADGRNYKPKTTANYFASLRYFARQAMAGRAPLDGPISVMVVASFPVPKSWSRAKRNAALALGWYTKKPDDDNIVRCLDAFTGIVWTDDCRRCELLVHKRYSVFPELRVIVRRLGPLLPPVALPEEIARA